MSKNDNFGHFQSFWLALKLIVEILKNNQIFYRYALSMHVFYRKKIERVIHTVQKNVLENAKIIKNDNFCLFLRDLILLG